MPVINQMCVDADLCRPLNVESDEENKSVGGKRKEDVVFSHYAVLETKQKGLLFAVSSR